MLDVLDADAVRAGQEDRVRVRGVDDRLDLEPERLGPAAVRLGRFDQEAEVVEERPVRGPGLAVHEDEARAADLDRAERGPRQAVALERGRRALRVGREERDVVEVVLGLGLRLDETDVQALAELELPSVPGGSSARAAARFETRSPTCFSGPGVRGPSASKNVSLPRRASVPISVNCPARRSRACRGAARSARRSSRRSATQNATWSSVSGRMSRQITRARRRRNLVCRWGANGNRAVMGRLRRVSCESDGISRRGRGRGFEYLDPRGRRIADDETLERIRALAIPPAWTDVWICPTPTATSRRSAPTPPGGAQYLYHPRWRARRDRQKFDRMLAFARALPRVRRVVARDLDEDDLSRERVLACAVRLLDRGLFRIGSEEYAEANGSYGLATLERQHVTLGREGRGGLRLHGQGRHAPDPGGRRPATCTTWSPG